MFLNQLITAQKSKAFVVSENSTPDDVIIGGQHLNKDQADMLVRNLGWTGRRHVSSLDAIKRTDSLLKTLSRALENPVYNNADVQFEAIRMNDSQKIVDRMTFVGTNPDGSTYDLSILHGMPGMGAWALVDNLKVANKVICKERSFSGVIKYLN